LSPTLRLCKPTSTPAATQSPQFRHDERIANPSSPIRFVDTEKWREDIKLDELVPTWDYPEKAEINKYYKQYYHKTDKVD
jgi:hypothetical protein